MWPSHSTVGREVKRAHWRKQSRFELHALIAPAVLSVVAVALLFFWQSHVGLSLWDEGFLWYGVQRVALGDVPLRDFMAYDPGRYYWSAVISSLSGDYGIISVRVAAASFQVLGLFAGLALLARCAGSHPTYLCAAAITLLAWMYPRHKLFDVSLSILLVTGLAYYISQPTPRRSLLLGASVGMAAVFGRNHGLYGAVGAISAMTYIALSGIRLADLGRGLVGFAAGIVIGFAPILAMLAVVPKFASAFWESIIFHFELGATNLPLPMPWPWRIPFTEIPAVSALHATVLGVFFTAILAFGPIGAAWLGRRAICKMPIAPALAAAVCLAIPYAHFAASRADASHIAQGVFPLLLGCLCVLAGRSERTRTWGSLLLCAVSLLVMVPLQPGWHCAMSHQCVEITLGRDKLKIDKGTAGDLALLNELAARYAPNGRSFMAVPFWPGAYAALGSKSPLWEIYSLFPRSEAFQKREIARIEAVDPGFVVIFDFALDGREDMRYRNTHPLIERYIRDRYLSVSDHAEHAAYQIFRSSNAGP